MFKVSRGSGSGKSRNATIALAIATACILRSGGSGWVNAETKTRGIIRINCDHLRFNTFWLDSARAACLQLQQGKDTAPVDMGKGPEFTAEDGSTGGNIVCPPCQCECGDVTDARSISSPCGGLGVDADEDNVDYDEFVEHVDEVIEEALDDGTDIHVGSTAGWIIGGVASALGLAYGAAKAYTSGGLGGLAGFAASANTVDTIRGVLGGPARPAPAPAPAGPMWVAAPGAAPLALAYEGHNGSAISIPMAAGGAPRVFRS